MICKDCKQEYDKWIPEGAYENNLCLLCNEWHWRIWEKEEANNLDAINRYQKEGHTHHCACRIVWGDGECTCRAERSGEYDPYWWRKGKDFNPQNIP